MRKIRSFWLASSPGFTLVELMAVVVILGILASVVAQTVPDAVARAKRSALASNLSGLQSAVDRFYADTNVYPTYEGEVPGSQPSLTFAAEVKGEAAYPGDPSRRFLGHYVHFLPPQEAVALGFDPTLGSRVYWGVARSGLVFCTQVPPSAGGWEDPNTVVHTQAVLAGQSLGEIMAR